MARPTVYLPRRRGWQFALSEAGVMVLALSAWFLVRFGRDALLVLQEDGGWRIALICLLGVLCLYICDLYECPVLGDWRELWRRLPLALGTMALALAVWQWLHPALIPGPRLALLSLAAAFLAVAGLRALWQGCVGLFRLRQAAVVIGSGALTQSLHRELRRHGELGWRLTGCLSAPEPESLLALAGAGARGWRQRLLATFPGGWASVDAGLRSRLTRAGCSLEDGVAWYERLSGKAALPAPLGVCRRSHLTRTAKRCFDVFVAAMALLLCWPLLLLLSALIALDSRGPVIFCQPRIGQYGRSFTIFKFRTMVHGAPALKNAPAAHDDPRCTRVGRWLRRLRLDELPQLWNILRGEMSLVGPRPFVPDQEQDCCRSITGYTQRWQVPPGATGWAQVNRGYCATLADNQEKLAYDLFYIRHLSLWFDAIILFETFKVVCFGRGGR
ncbi:MAG: hypothetical protein EPN33_09920 [Acidobacteria bacterium]|nr:MAG: hypothetical protein EPN33_09920 [Acidobacteriota bacterium]